MGFYFPAATALGPAGTCWAALMLKAATWPGCDTIGHVAGLEFERGGLDGLGPGPLQFRTDYAVFAGDDAPDRLGLPGGPGNFFEGLGEKTLVREGYVAAGPAYLLAGMVK